MTVASAQPDPIRGLDPRDHIDRIGEQELFRNILT